MGSWTKDCVMLAANCGPDPCLAAVCAAKPLCCSVMWSMSCVDLVKTTCNTTCSCAHPSCQEGVALAPDCDPCVAAICKADKFCCASEWDEFCVGEAGSICGIVCE
jgi:hypothetical protein